MHDDNSDMMLLQVWWWCDRYCDSASVFMQVWWYRYDDAAVI